VPKKGAKNLSQRLKKFLYPCSKFTLYLLKIASKKAYSKWCKSCIYLRLTSNLPWIRSPNMTHAERRILFVGDWHWFYMFRKFLRNMTSTKRSTSCIFHCPTSNLWKLKEHEIYSQLLKEFVSPCRKFTLYLLKIATKNKYTKWSKSCIYSRLKSNLRWIWSRTWMAPNEGICV
jgi:hypothetical protein